jgi:hypothetical protein
MRYRICGFLVIAFAATLPLASAADEVGSARQAPAFDQIDANHDGTLSRSELPDGLQDLRMHFSQYAYADHRITRATYEWYTAPALQWPGIRFARPAGRYAFSQPYIRRQAPGTAPTPPVHRR